MPQITAVPASTGQIKSSIVRGYLAILAADGLLAVVADRIPARSRSAVLDPPPSSAWLPGEVLDDLVVAAAEIRGDEYVKPLARRAAERYIGVAQPIIQGLLRVFGTSPSVLLSRMEFLSQNSARGTGYEWVASSPTSGTLVWFPPPGRPMSPPILLVMEVAIEQALALCSAKGSISAPVLENRGQRTTVEFQVRWGQSAST